VLGLYSRAIQLDANSYSAWHEWGLCSFRAAEEAKKKEGRHSSFSGNLEPSPQATGSGSISGPNVGATTHVGHMVNAAKGLLRAIALGTRIQSASVTQDMLCFLSLWFRYVHVPELHATIAAGLSSVHIDTWLGVLPQLIARLDHPEEHGRLLLHELLLRLGTKHTQALAYPLTVALKSSSEERKRAAGEIMMALRAHHPKLVDQASMVATELVRVAILWQETWHDSLEDASRQYFGEGNVQAMLDNLLAAHELMNLGPNTLQEMSFVKKHGQELHDAYIALQNYKRVMEETGKPIPEHGAAPVPARHQRKAPLSLEEGFLAQAWDLYYKVFKSINEQIVSLTSLELHFCSPLLSNATDLDLGVPGTYHISGTCVRIKSFNQVVPLIRSKQHPRKIKINGEDGNEYGFLLKVRA
jgi:serine/threonine-protein kinase mTOR